jgi:hypothetical protein
MVAAADALLSGDGVGLALTDEEADDDGPGLAFVAELPHAAAPESTSTAAVRYRAERLKPPSM